MHVLFELEDIYGLHFEKVGDNYQLAFSKGEYSSANWIIEGLAAWVKKRDELQPDINDSNSTIADKKNDYIRWKARYPYNFAEEITSNFALVQKFNEDASSRLLVFQNFIAACLRWKMQESNSLYPWMKLLANEAPLFILN